MKLDTKSFLSYDTVGFFCQSEYCRDEITKNFNFLIESETKLKIFETSYKNIWIKQSLGGASVVLSLPKFHLGSNLFSLDIHSTKEAIEEISELLGLSIKNALVFKLHFGANIVMEQPVLQYLNCLISGNNLKKMMMESTVYFENDRRVIAFYDKLRELLEKKEEIPTDYQSLNLLRYELRFNKRPKKQLFMDSLKGEDLYQPKTLRTLSSRWYKDYTQLKKEKKFKTLDLIEVSSHKEMLEQLLFLGVNECGGGDMLINSIEEKRSKLKIKKMYDNHNKYVVSQMKNSVLNVSSCKIENDATECIQELNKKIKEIFTNEKF